LISYAQNFEDVILMRVFRDVSKGCYVDIGANDPKHHSVSHAFYVAGWRGVHVEPIADFAERLRSARPDETVLQVAVSTSDDPIELFDFADTGLTTGVKAYADRHAEGGRKSRSIEVETQTLADILERVEAEDIHWLKIDVEGMERDVLESWRDSAIRPWVVIVESTLPNSPEEAYDHWEALLLERGYSFEYFDGLNRFYLHKNQSDLAERLGAGPNVFDPFQLAPESHLVRVAVSDVEARLAIVENAWKTEQAARQDAIKHREEAEAELSVTENAWKTEQTARIAAQEVAEAISEEVAKRDETIGALHHDVLTRDSTIGKLQTETTERDEIIRNQYELIHRLQSQVESRDASIEAARHREQTLQHTLAAKGQETDALSVALAGARAEAAQMAGQVEAVGALRDALDEIFASSSWKLTAPLRTAITKYRTASQRVRGRLHRYLDGRRQSPVSGGQIFRTPALDHLPEPSALSAWSQKLGVPQEQGAK